MSHRFLVIILTGITAPVIIPQVSGFGEENPPEDRGDGVLENSGDWLIEEGEEISYQDRIIVVNGDLIINGSLELERCTLIMNASDSMLRVSGHLALRSSNISGNNTFYSFIVTGSIDLRNSDLRDIAGSTSHPFIGGLQLYTNDVEIIGGSITSAEFTGLYLTSDITIRDLTITNNVYNVIMNGSDSKFYNCTIRDPGSVNIFMLNGSTPLFIEGAQAGERKFNDEASSLSMGHEMHVQVTYKNGTSIAGAEVTVSSTNGNISETYETDHTGWVRNMVFPEETIYKTRPDQVYYPYRVTAEKFGLIVIESVPFDSESTILIVLSGDQFGEALSRGDFNGDGWIDLAVGVPKNRSDALTPGAVFIYLNDGALEFEQLTESMADLAIKGEDGTEFGSVIRSDDINGDGFDDLLVSAPYQSWDGGESGRVHAFYGSDQPAWNELSDAAFTLDGEPGSHFGRVLFTCDLNNDEYSDFIIGDDISSHVYYGSSDLKYDFTKADLHYLAPNAKGIEDTTGEDLAKLPTNDDERYAVMNPNTPKNIMHLMDFPVDDIRGEITVATLWVQYTSDKEYGMNDHERSYIYYHVGDGWQETIRPIRNGNNWRAESTQTFNLKNDGVTTKEQLANLQLYLENVDGTGYFSGEESNIYFDFIVIQVNTKPMPANHSLEAGNLSSGDVNGDGFEDLIISDRMQQIIYFGSPSGLYVPQRQVVEIGGGNASGIHAGEDGLSLMRIGQIENGDFSNGWENWTFTGNRQGQQNANLRMVNESAGDWEISEYSGGPTGGFGGDGDHLNGFGGKSTGKLRSDPFLIGTDVDAISLWYRWQAISFDKNEGMNIKLYRASNDSVIRTIDEWMPTEDSSRYEIERSVIFPVTDLRGETVYIAMEAIGGDGGYDDGLLQIDDLDLFPYIYRHEGTYDTEWMIHGKNIISFTPVWTEQPGNGTIVVKYRMSADENWNDSVELSSDRMVVPDGTSERIQFRVEMTNNGNETPLLNDLMATFQYEGDIVPLSLGTQYGNVGSADVNGDSLDDLLFHDRWGNGTSGIDIFYGDRNLTLEYNSSGIETFLQEPVSGFSVLDLESDGKEEICVIGETVRIIDENSDTLWERPWTVKRVHEDVVSDPAFQLNTGWIRFLPSMDREMRILDITAPAYIDPGEELSLNVTVGNIGSFDETDRTLFLNITADDYSYSDSIELDIQSLQTRTHRFVWDVPEDEGIDYTIEVVIPVAGDRIPENNNRTIGTTSKMHAILLTTPDLIMSAHGGDDLIFNLTLSNIGTFDMENVSLEATLPEGWEGEFTSEGMAVLYVVVTDALDLVFTARSPDEEMHGDFTVGLHGIAGNAISDLEVTATILRPDLRVDEIHLYRADGTQTNETIHGVANDYEKVMIRVTNYGPTYATSFELDILVNDVPYSTLEHDGLAEGEGVWFSLDIIPEEGFLRISVTVDTGDTVPEMNETDNSRNATFTIKGTDPIGPYDIIGKILNIHGEGVGFVDVQFEWGEEHENTYTDANGNFSFTLNASDYSDGQLLYLNASDGDNVTSIHVHIYSEDGERTFLLTLNQYLVELSGPDIVSNAGLNDTILIGLDITNKGNINATFIIATPEVPEDWSVTILDVPGNMIWLGIGETTDVTMKIITSSDPIHAKGYQKYFTTILVFAELYSPGNDSFTHGVEILPIQSLRVSPIGTNVTSAKPGDVLEFSFTIENRGNGLNTFIPELLGDIVHEYQFNVSHLTIDIGETAEFSLTLRSPYLESGVTTELLVGGSETYIENAVIQLTILDMFGVSCVDVPEFTALPGETLSVPLIIRNEGNVLDNITITGQSENPLVEVSNGWAILDMQEETTFMFRITVPANSLNDERIPVTITLGAHDGTFVDLGVNITILEVRGISLSIVETIIFPARDFTRYSYSIEARNDGNGPNTFHFRAEGSHPHMMVLPLPQQLGPGESRTIRADILVPLNHLNVIDNYLVPLDDMDEYADLNLRILSYSSSIETSVEISQEDSRYYYDINVTNYGTRFERLDVTVNIPEVDGYGFGSIRWEGGTNKHFLDLVPGESDQFRIWITTPDQRIYWGSDLSVSLKSGPGDSMVIPLHKPPIALISKDIPEIVTYESICTFSGSQSLWDIREFIWEFSDGGQLINSTVPHSFSRSGPQSVTLTVRDDHDLTASRTIIIDVVNSDPIAVIRVLPLTRTVSVDQFVTFDASFSQDRDGKIVKYSWDLGEPGESIEGILPEIHHQFSMPGTYVVTLFVTDNDGGAANGTTTITVTSIPDDIDPTRDDGDEEVTTVDPISYLPAILMVIVLFGGLIQIIRRKMVINGLLEDLHERSGRE